MKFYEFGKTDKPVIILLPGTCCHWKANFEAIGKTINGSDYIIERIERNEIEKHDK